MRIICLIADGRGRVHVAALRAPDLRRRELAAETGTAHLLAVALAPDRVAPSTIVAGIDRRLAAARIGEGLYAATAAEARQALARAQAQVRRAHAVASVRRALTRMVRRSRVRSLRPSAAT